MRDLFRYLCLIFCNDYSKLEEIEKKIEYNTDLGGYKKYNILDEKKKKTNLILNGIKCYLFFFFFIKESK